MNKYCGRVHSRHRSSLAAVALTLLARSTLAQGVAVVDSIGEPVPFARITLLAPHEGGGVLDRLMPPIADERTDKLGRSDVRVPARAGTLLVVDHPQFIPHVERSPKQGLARVVLQSGQSWAGRIAGAEREIEHGRVCATWQTDLEPAHSRSWRRCAELGRDGDFTLLGVPTRQAVLVEARADGLVPGKTYAKAGEAFEIRLRRGLMVRGRVFDRVSKKPIAEAVARSELGSLAHTDPDGHFELAVSHLPATLEVGARGYQVHRGQIEEGDLEKTFEVMLLATPTMTGRLLDEDGKPLLHALLWIEQGDEAVGTLRGRQRSVDLREDGSFTAGLERPGTYRLRITTRANHRTQHIPAFSVVDGENVDIGTHVLTGGAGVEGVARSTHDGAPVAGISVELLPVGPQLLQALRDRQRANAVSDDEGRFSAFGLEAGRYELRIRHDDFATQVRSLTVGRDQIADLGDVWLDAGARLRGRVVDERGGRQALQVVVLGPDPESMVPLVTTMTDHEGRFTGPALGRDRYRVRVRSGQPLLTTEFDLVKEGSGVELVVAPRALHGLVTEHGNPVAGGTIMVQPAFDPDAVRGKMILRMSGGEQPFGYGLQQPPQIGSVEADGTFAFAEVPGQPVRATYIADGGRRAVRYLGVPEHEDQPVRFEIAGASVHGRTLDAETGDDVRASIRLLDGLGVEVAHLDCDNSFQIDQLAPGRYLARAFAEGYAPSTASFDLADSNVEIALNLEPAAASTLVVRLERWDGSPVAGAPVTLLEPSGVVAAALPTNLDGRRVLSHLAAGEYALVWSDSISGTGAITVTLRAGELTTVEHTLPSGSRITLSCGAVTCRNAAIGLRLITPDGFDLAPFLPGLDAVSSFAADGRLGLGALSPGNYQVHVVLGTGDSADRTFEVGEGRTQMVSVF